MNAANEEEILQAESPLEKHNVKGSEDHIENSDVIVSQSPGADSDLIGLEAE